MKSTMLKILKKMGVTFLFAGVVSAIALVVQSLGVRVNDDQSETVLGGLDVPSASADEAYVYDYSYMGGDGGDGGDCS